MFLSDSRREVEYLSPAEQQTRWHFNIDSRTKLELHLKISPGLRMENVIRTQPKLRIKVTPCHKQIFVLILT